MRGACKQIEAGFSKFSIYRMTQAALVLLLLHKLSISELRTQISNASQAMLWRQWLLKRRSPASTIVEVLSPIVLISALVNPGLTARSTKQPLICLPYLS